MRALQAFATSSAVAWRPKRTNSPKRSKWIATGTNPSEAGVVTVAARAAPGGIDGVEDRPSKPASRLRKDMFGWFFPRQSILKGWVGQELLTRKKDLEK